MRHITGTLTDLLVALVTFAYNACSQVCSCDMKIVSSYEKFDLKFYVKTYSWCHCITECRFSCQKLSTFAMLSTCSIPMPGVVRGFDFCRCNKYVPVTVGYRMINLSKFNLYIILNDV